MQLIPRDTPKAQAVPLNMSGLWGGIVTYLRLVWVDLCCVACLAIFLLGLYFTPVNQESSRVVPMWLDGVTLRGPTELSYPYIVPQVSSIACALIAIGSPILIIAAFQIKLRSWWDFHRGALGALKAVLLATFIQVVLKQSVGGFRPHYLAVCNPDIDLLLRDNIAAGALLFMSPTACTGDRLMVRFALQSFPSGHSAASFAASIFLALYLNAKIKTFADFGCDFWSLFVTIAPLIGASVIAGGLHLIHHHHPGDIIFGIIIGLIAGTFSYRISYASIFDFRYNHIPLPPAAAHIRFSYSTSRKPDGSGNIMESNAKLADGLVPMEWWGSARRDVYRNDRRWLRGVTSLKRTGAEMGKTKSSLDTESALESALEPPSPLGGQHMSSALRDALPFRRYSAPATLT